MSSSHSECCMIDLLVSKTRARHGEERLELSYFIQTHFLFINRRSTYSLHNQDFNPFATGDTLSCG